MHHRTYQDLWINGACYEKGQRECEKRYAMIRDYLKDCWVNAGFQQILDLGANRGYFSVRLCEDFTNAQVIAVESDKALLVQAAQATPRLNAVYAEASLQDLKWWFGPGMASIGQRFAFVLALSVIHHLKCNSLDQILDMLTAIGKCLICEFPIGDPNVLVGCSREVQEAGRKVCRQAEELHMSLQLGTPNRELTTGKWLNFTLLGYGEWEDKGTQFERPIYAIRVH